MRCTRCGEREALVERLAIGPLAGPVCPECAVELARQLVTGASGDLKGLTPSEAGNGLLPIGRPMPQPAPAPPSEPSELQQP